MLRLAVAAELELAQYRERLAETIGSTGGVDLLDVNTLTAWDTEEQLIENCVELVREATVDYAALISVSGSGLSMLANKHRGIRSAVLLDQRFISEAVDLQANMCEVSAHLSSPEQASEIILAFARARGDIR